MIKPFTCVCMMLAAGSGLYLYQTKHRAQMLDREIGRTLKQADVARDRIGVLRGEWALLNEPDRLSDLNQQHLALKTLAPTQFTALADLGARLPAPLPQGRPDGRAAVVPEEAAPEPQQPVAAAARPIVTRMAAVVQVPSPVLPSPAARAFQPAPVQTAPVQAAPVQSAPVQSAPVQTAPLPLPPPAMQPAPRVLRAVAAAPQPALPPPPMMAAPPRFTAPIVSVSAAPMVVPPALPPRVQGLATHSAVAAPADHAADRAVARPRPASPAYTTGFIPAAAPTSSQGSSQGAIQGSVLGSASGGARPALPAPVPYGAMPR